MKTGIFKMPENEYRNLLALSYSGLKDLAISPADYYYHHIDPEGSKKIPTLQMEIGTALHKLILEPNNFDNEIAVFDGIKRGKKWDSFEYKDRIVLTPETFDTVFEMSRRIEDHPIAGEIIKLGIKEMAVIWKDPTHDFLCKAKPDILSKEIPAIADIKSCISADPNEFARAVANFKYYFQAAYYLNGINEAQKKIYYVDFIFICVENKPPHKVAVYSSDYEMLDTGRSQIKPLIDLYAKCIKSNKWPGLKEEIQELSLPAWAKY